MLNLKMDFNKNVNELSENLKNQQLSTYATLKEKWSQINGKKITIIAEAKDKTEPFYFASVHKDIFELETVYGILHPGYAKSNVNVTFKVVRKNNENTSVFLKKASYNFNESVGTNVFSENNKTETYLCNLGGEDKTLEIVPDYSKIEAIDIRAKSNVDPSFFRANTRVVDGNDDIKIAVIFNSQNVLSPTVMQAVQEGTPAGKHEGWRNQTSFGTVAVPLAHAQQIQKEAITLEKFNFDGGFSAEFFSSDPFKVEIELIFCYPDGKPRNPDHGQRTLFEKNQKEMDEDILGKIMEEDPQFETVTSIKEGLTRTLEPKKSVASRTPKHLKRLNKYKGLFQNISLNYNTSEQFETHLMNGNATNKELFEHLQHFFGVSIFFYQKSDSVKAKTIEEAVKQTSPDDIIHAIDVWLNEVWLCFQKSNFTTEQEEKKLNAKFTYYFKRHSFEKMTRYNGDFNPLLFEDPTSFLIHLLTTEMGQKILECRKEFKSKNQNPVLSG